MPARHRALALAAAVFLASGFAALVYQVIWQRVLGIVSGVHIQSVTLIVTAFMAGLGFGSLAGGRLADRLSRSRAVVAFALCELAIGLFGLASPWLYYDVAYLRLGFLANAPLVLPLLQFALLLVPTLLMGASLPLLSRALVWDTDSAARTISILYGLNTLGAALGAFASAWLLIGALGFVGTIRVAAALNLVAALGALAILRQLGEEPRAAAAPAEIPKSGGAAAPSSSVTTWCLVYALSGFVALSFELVWFRTLDVALKASPYTFGHLLGIFLLFLGLGSVLGSRVAPRLRQPRLAFAWTQWAVSASAGLVLLGLLRAPTTWPGLDTLHAYWQPGTPALSFHAVATALADPAARGASEVLSRAWLAYAALPVVLLGLPTVLMGLSFAFIQRAVQTEPREVGWRVGAIQTANIAGSILGSLVTGALLLHVLGAARSAALLVASGVVFAALAFVWTRPGGRRGAAGLAVAASLGLAVATPGPKAFWSRLHGGAEPGAIFVAEDASGVAALQPRPGRVAMRVNGRVHSSIPYGGAHTLLGLIPALVHPRLERAFVVGLGSGNTAWAVAAGPDVEKVEVYEIVEPEIDVLRQLQQSGRRRALLQLLSDPRIEVHFGDGRLALRRSDAFYDLIEADALDPSMAYSGNLYSREFFELARRRLKPRGLFCTYVPTERTRRTVVRVFPHVLDFHSPGFASFILASNKPIEFDREAIRKRLESRAVQHYLRAGDRWDRTARDFARYFAKLEVTRIERGQPIAVDPVELGDLGDVNTDLFPRDEYDKSFTGAYQ